MTKVKGRYIWGGVVVLVALARTAQTLYNLHDSNVLSTIGFVVVALVLAWIFYWAGIVLYRAIATRLR